MVEGRGRTSAELRADTRNGSRCEPKAPAKLLTHSGVRFSRFSARLSDNSNNGAFQHSPARLLHLLQARSPRLPSSVFPANGLTQLKHWIARIAQPATLPGGHVLWSNQTTILTYFHGGTLNAPDSSFPQGNTPSFSVHFAGSY